MSEDQSSLPAYPIHPLGSGQSGPPPTPQYAPRPRLGWAVWLLLILVVILILPYLVQRIEYAYVRGRDDAAADVAREVLDGKSTFGIADYREVVKVIQPSVVGVKSIRMVGAVPNDERAYLFSGRGPQFREQGQGSGVIVDASGYIITNSHVVDQAAQVSVELSDGSRHPATIVGSDSALDVAVLKINATSLREARWGDSDALETGDPVLAIGNPFGLARSVTAGIISAKGRHAVIENVMYQDFLQTDAAVNPGNSGGPLVNMKAEVVGINTAIVGPSYQGISFAIPSNMVQRIYDQLKRGEKVARGWLGVSMQRELTPDVAEKLGLKSTVGALVTGVLPGSPAANAGLAAGDVVIRWNGKPINDQNELAQAVQWTEIGSKAKVVVIRNGEEQTFTVTVGQRPDKFR